MSKKFDTKLNKTDLKARTLPILHEISWKHLSFVTSHGCANKKKTSWSLTTVFILDYEIDSLCVALGRLSGIPVTLLRKGCISYKFAVSVRE